MEGEVSPEKSGMSEMISTSTPIRDNSDTQEIRSLITPDKDIPQDSKIPQILNRTIPGNCSVQNRCSLSWGQDGCISYGCGNLVAVVEPATCQYLQVLSKHRHPVVRTAWSCSPERRLGLASADEAGHIIVWDVIQGEHTQQLHDGNLPISELRWLDSRIEKTSHLLLSIHPPNHLILWNTQTGAKVWKCSYNETLLGFDIDPFNCYRFMFRCPSCVLFIEDFHPDKCPKSDGKKFYIVGGKSGASRRSMTAEASLLGDEKNKGTKLSKIMRQMVLGENKQTQNLETSSDCLSASFHKGVKSLIILAFSKEVLLVDVQLSQALGTINLERVHSPLAGIRSCAEKDVIYILHESGSVSVWNRKPNLSVLATPSFSRSQSMSGFPRTPHSTAVLNEDGYSLAGSDVLLEVSYESRVQSDHVRMGKSCKVLGLSIHPVTEKQIAFLTSDGRVYFLDYLESKVLGQDNISKESKLYSVPLLTQGLGLGEKISNPKMMIRSILGSSSSPVCVIRMCPPLTVKNWRDYVPMIAAGSISGHLQIFNIATGSLTRELAVHTNEIKGLEWITGNPAISLLSYSHHPLSGSNFVRNELMFTNILTGKIRNLRGDRGEETKITMIRVSHAKQYFILAFTAGPFELWDARKLCLLRTMPKKFPLVSALIWSPNHKPKRKSVSGLVETSDISSPSPTKEDGFLVKEHFLFSDLASQLYHFSVEGQSIRDGARIPAETGLGTVNAIASKAELIVRGDTDGNINIWNIKDRQSKNIHTGRGNIKQVQFSPGRGNMKILVLYTHGVALWDLKELELINELRTPRDIPDVLCVDWAASDRVTILCKDGGIRFMGLALAGASSSILEYPRNQLPSCVSLLSQKLLDRFHFNLTFPEVQVDLIEDLGLTPEQTEYSILQTYQKIQQDSKLNFVERNMEFAHLFGFRFEKKFWSLLHHLSTSRKLSRSYDLYSDRTSYIEQEDEKCKLHLNRAADKESRSQVTARLLCLGQVEPAVQLLLETEPTEETFLSDQLLACLISTTTNSVGGNHLSTTKMVATKLIAEGKLWEGVQLLCLVNKVWDACTYLRASKHWEESMWLGKCRLNEDEYREMTKKFAEFLVNQGRLQDAALLHASVENWSACLEVLHLGQYRGLAARLLHHISEAVDPVLAEAIWMEAARFLFEIGHRSGAIYFCDKIGKKGEELKQEFYHG